MTRRAYHCWRVEVDDDEFLCLRHFSIDYPLGAVADSVGREDKSWKWLPGLTRKLRSMTGSRREDHRRVRISGIASITGR